MAVLWAAGTDHQMAALMADTTVDRSVATLGLLDALSADHWAACLEFEWADSKVSLMVVLTVALWAVSKAVMTVCNVAANWADSKENKLVAWTVDLKAVSRAVLWAADSVDSWEA